MSVILLIFVFKFLLGEKIVILGFVLLDIGVIRKVCEWLFLR